MSILARENYISNGYSLGHFYKKKFLTTIKKFSRRYKKKFLTTRKKISGTKKKMFSHIFFSSFSPDIV